MLGPFGAPGDQHLTALHVQVLKQISDPSPTSLLPNMANVRIHRYRTAHSSTEKENIKYQNLFQRLWHYTCIISIYDFLAYIGCYIVGVS